MTWLYWKGLRGRNGWGILRGGSAKGENKTNENGVLGVGG